MRGLTGKVAVITGVALPVDGGVLAKAPLTSAGFDEWMSRLHTTTTGPNA